MEDGGDLGSGRRVQHTPKDQVPIVKNQDGNRAEKTQNFDPVQLVLVPALNFSAATVFSGMFARDAILLATDPLAGLVTFKTVERCARKLLTIG